MVSEVDAQLGRVWSGLRDRGMWDDTVIVVTADHGEQLGDHGLIQKLGYFEQSYHILGIVRDPRHPQAHGTVVTEFTENIDVFPTLCDAIGLEVGRVRYGAFVDADGLMVDDGTVFNTAQEDHCWVMTNGRDHDERFGELLQDLDAEFEWVTPSMPHLGVIGPRSREVVQKLTDEDIG